MVFQPGDSIQMMNKFKSTWQGLIKNERKESEGSMETIDLMEIRENSFEKAIEPHGSKWGESEMGKLEGNPQAEEFDKEFWEEIEAKAQEKYEFFKRKYKTLGHLNQEAEDGPRGRNCRSKVASCSSQNGKIAASNQKTLEETKNNEKVSGVTAKRMEPRGNSKNFPRNIQRVESQEKKRVERQMEEIEKIQKERSQEKLENGSKEPYWKLRNDQGKPKKMSERIRERLEARSKNASVVEEDYSRSESFDPFSFCQTGESESWEALLMTSKSQVEKEPGNSSSSSRIHSETQEERQIKGKESVLREIKDSQPNEDALRRLKEAKEMAKRVVERKAENERRTRPTNEPLRVGSNQTKNEPRRGRNESRERKREGASVQKENKGETVKTRGNQCSNEEKQREIKKKKEEIDFGKIEKAEGDWETKKRERENMKHLQVLSEEYNPNQKIGKGLLGFSFQNEENKGIRELRREIRELEITNQEKDAEIVKLNMVAQELQHKLMIVLSKGRKSGKLV